MIDIAVDHFTEDDVAQMTMTIARLRRAEAQYLQTRDAQKGEALYITIDGFRWKLKAKYGIIVAAFPKKFGPEEATTA